MQRHSALEIWYPSLPPWPCWRWSGTPWTDQRECHFVEASDKCRFLNMNMKNTLQLWMKTRTRWIVELFSLLQTTKLFLPGSLFWSRFVVDRPKILERMSSVQVLHSVVSFSGCLLLSFILRLYLLFAHRFDASLSRMSSASVSLSSFSPFLGIFHHFWRYLLNNFSLFLVFPILFVVFVSFCPCRGLSCGDTVAHQTNPLFTSLKNHYQL